MKQGGIKMCPFGPSIRIRCGVADDHVAVELCHVDKEAPVGQVGTKVTQDAVMCRAIDVEGRRKVLSPVVVFGVTSQKPVQGGYGGFTLCVVVR